MSNQDYEPPRFWKILVASIAFVSLVVLLWMFSSVIKRVGDILLYLPAQLGFVQRVRSSEIKIIDLRTASPVILEFTKPGRYAMFTGDRYLLQANALSGESDEIWLAIRSQTTGEQIKIVSVERPIRPYDTPLADGRPIFAFEIVAPDKYEIIYPPYHEATIAVVPDYMTGKESVIWFAYSVQVAIFLILLGIIYYPHYKRTRKRIKSIEAPKVQRQTKSQAFWEAEMKRDKQKTSDSK